jgi:hypothetical protein
MLHSDRHYAPGAPLEELLVQLIALHIRQRPEVRAAALRTRADRDEDPHRLRQRDPADWQAVKRPDQGSGQLANHRAAEGRSGGRCGVNQLPAQSSQALAAVAVDTGEVVSPGGKASAGIRLVLSLNP